MRTDWRQDSSCCKQKQNGYKSCNITSGQQKTVRDRELNTTVERNSLIQDLKIQEKAREDTSEIRLQIYETGSDNTSQENTQLRSSLARDTMESTSTRGFTEVWEIQREQVHFVGIKFSKLLTVESLTRCVSCVLPNYSLMPHCHGLLGYQLQLFSRLSPWKRMGHTAENWERPWKVQVFTVTSRTWQPMRKERYTD